MHSVLNDRCLVSFQSLRGRLHVEMETERLFIRSYLDNDFANYVHLYGNDIITKYFDHGKPRTESEVRDLINKKGEKYFTEGKPFGFFSIFIKSGMTFIGQIDLLPTEDPGISEVGIILHEQYHNQGFSTESARTIIFSYVEEINNTLDFDELPILKILATVHPKNLSSKKVLEKLGMSLFKIQERFGNPRLWYFLPLISKKQKIEVL